MITTEGRRWIRQYLSQQVETLGASVAFGVGKAVATAADIDLEYEVMRAPIDFRSYDINTGEVVLRVIVPITMAAKLTEVGLWANASDLDGGAESLPIVDFNSDAEAWTTTGTFITNSRIGTSALNLTANGTSTLTTEGLSLAQFGNKDKIALAIGNVFTGSCTLAIRFCTDASNYFSFSSALSAGDQIKKFEKGAATITGNPTWESINSIQFIVSSASGLSMRLEGVRFVNSENSLADYVLIARSVIPEYTVDPEKTTEMEIRLGVNFT